MRISPFNWATRAQKGEFHHFPPFSECMVNSPFERFHHFAAPTISFSDLLMPS